MPGRPLPFADLVIRLKDALARTDRQGPVCTFVLGSGFSYPLFPLTSDIVRRDLVWWMDWRKRGAKGTFPPCPDPLPPGLADEAAVIWKKVHAEIESHPDGHLKTLKFKLDAHGLPEAADAGKAYQAILCDECRCLNLDALDRAGYFRALVQRVGNRLNGAHFFLASLLADTHSPTPGHTRRLCGSIVTTNFDPLLQRSLQLVNLPYYVSDRPDSLPDADDGDGAVHIVHAHGTIYRYLMLNGPREIKAAADVNKARLSAAFRTHMVVIVGYSGWDDAIMAALEELNPAPQGVYWCDRHAAIDQSNLSARAKELLANRTGFHYVPLPGGGADEAMAQLYYGLTGNKKPRLLQRPVEAMRDQLNGIDLTGIFITAAPGMTVSIPSADGKLLAAVADREAERIDLGAVQGETMELLDAAIAWWNGPSDGSTPSDSELRRSGPHPSDAPPRNAACTGCPFAAAAAPPSSGPQSEPPQQSVRDSVPTTSPNPQDRVFELRIMLSRAEEELLRGNVEACVPIYDRVLQEADLLDTSQLALTLSRRGFAHAAAGRAAAAVADFSAVVTLPGIPPELVAKALFNRGITHGDAGRVKEEVADYSAIVALPGAPAEQVARALINRGITHAAAGRTEEAMADFTAVVAMPGAPAEHVAKALLNRGAAHGEAWRADEEMSDLTAVIALPGAPAEHVATALLYRGIRHGEAGRAEEEVADYSAVVALPGAPADRVARALVNRGVAYGQAGRVTEEMADYSAVVALPEAPAEQVAKALINRGITHSQAGRTEEAIADYSAVVALPGAPTEQVAKALINRGITHSQAGRTEEAIADYSAVVTLPGAPTEVVERARKRLRDVRPGE